MTQRWAFYVGKCEVTQEQYLQVMGTNPSRFRDRNLPVETVSWEDAQSFCKKASERTGWTIRLPAEAEWEHACRAGTRTARYVGDVEADLDGVGWFYLNSSGRTHPVGEKTPNAWGVCDLYGNVFEWCEDEYHDDYNGAPTDGGVWVNPPGAGRVLRGGSWDDFPRKCRSAYRFRAEPDRRGDGIGFRVVVLAPGTP